MLIKVEFMRYVKVGIIMFLIGLAGVGAGKLVEHLWQDHTTLHILIQLEAQRQQAIQRNNPVAQEVPK